MSLETGSSMRVIPPETFKTTPWKNGGGVTHEIAREAAGDGYAWRLSLAEVERDGPFSAFPGMARILTVVEGAGMRLVHADGVIEAPPLQPVLFSGELAVAGACIDGPVRNLNLIYDPKLVMASVTCLKSGMQDLPSSRPSRRCALYAISGRARIGSAQDVETGSMALFDGRAEGIVLDEGSTALLLTLDRQKINKASP